MGAPCGERNGHCRLKDEVVHAIRDLREIHNLTLPEIARRLGIESLKTVEKIMYYERRPFPDPLKRMDLREVLG